MPAAILNHTIWLHAKEYLERIQDGKKFWIVPGTIIVEGVLNGFMVPAEELRDFYNAWNGTDITLGHPKENGGSAGVPKPDVPIIGRFYHAEWDEERKAITGEFWLDVDALNSAEGGPDVLKNIEAGNPLEVSTAYYADWEAAEGSFKDTAYFGIHHNLIPDHIAVLPHDVGACSIQDGCGLLVNSGAIAGCIHNSQKETGMKKFSVKALRESFPGLAKLSGNADDNAEVELDPEALLTDEEKEKLKAAPPEEPEETQEPETPEPQALPKEVVEMAQAFKEIGGAAGFKKLIEGVQVVGTFAQNVQAQQDSQKQIIIANILATGQDVYSEDELKAMELPALHKVVRLVAPGYSMNYSGVNSCTTPTHNAEKLYAEPTPVLLAKRDPEKKEE